MTTLHIQFWAKYRGVQNVFVKVGSQSAECVASIAVRQAAAQFASRFPFPDYDRKEMVCIGLTDGIRRVNAKDVPTSSNPETGV